MKATRTCLLLLLLFGLVVSLLAVPLVNARDLGSLKTVDTPKPKNLNQFLRTNSTGGIDPTARKAAIALGKALFWDQAAGSDGQACASCHFEAGADNRTKNQLDPGLRAVPPDPLFTPPFTANFQLAEGNFPFFNLANPDDRSTLISDTNDIASSQGVFDAKFLSIDPGPCPSDQPNIGSICDTLLVKPDPAGVGDIFKDPFTGTQVRNVEPRNTPTTINAVFNFRNFWDSRARNEFNGVDPIGDLDPFARVLLKNAGSLQQVQLKGKLRLEDSSLASQSVGPPLSDMEMSYRGRSFPDLGRKMLGLPRALPSQIVAPDDSVLGNNKQTGVKSNYPLPGINKTYKQLIQAAFQDRWWSDTVWTNGFTQTENNFSLFWGIAIQMYESTLRADDSLFDRAFDAGNPRTCGEIDQPACVPGWDATLKLGLSVFEGKGKCFACHSGPELTNASVANVKAEKLERMLMGNGECAVYDNGFYNTAVRQCVGDIHGNVNGVCDDAGIGTTIGPLDLPLSMSRFFQLVLQGDPNALLACQPFGCKIPPVIAQPGCPSGPLLADERIAVVGSFKTAGLRNIELQAPFFHNGGDLSLEHTVQFYDRGGNFPGVNEKNFDPNIEDLGLTNDEKAALVALMKAMTDDRVRYQQAPFDHPQLFIPRGTLGTLELPAVGKGGSDPLPTFFENLAP